MTEWLREVHNDLDATLASAATDRSFSAMLRETVAAAQAAAAGLVGAALLPVLTCYAAGGDAPAAYPVAAAWRALHIATKLLDDVEDDAGRSSSPIPAATAQVINLATGLFATANMLLERLPVAIWAVVQPRFNRTIVHMAGGQHVDLARGTFINLDQYLAMMGAKSASFLALAAWAGTQCATTDLAYTSSSEEFGFAIGMLLQIGDDLHDFRKADADGDLATGQRSLPIQYALSVTGPAERRRLETLLAQAPSDPEAVTRARKLIAALGAEAYMLAEVTRYRHRAEVALQRMGSTDRVEPLWRWFRSLSGSRR